MISDAEVAETPYTLRCARGKKLTVPLVVRRIKDARHRDEDALFPVWRYHPFVTNSDLPADRADITHRRHAIIETTLADLIDGPLAHIPSGLFAAPARKPMLHLPAHWPRQEQWNTLWNTVIGNLSAQPRAT